MSICNYINWFFLYSFLGYLLECIVLTVEYKRPVVDRGFANVMIRLFGSFWWDYSHKPFNYRGIICLESSLAWGLLGLFFFNYLDGWVRTAVGYIPGRIGKVLAVLLTLFYVFDFIRCIRMRLGIPEEGEEGETEETIGRLKVY